MWRRLEAINHSVTAPFCLWGQSGALAWDILPFHSQRACLLPLALPSSGHTLLLLLLLFLLPLIELFTIFRALCLALYMHVLISSSLEF